MFQVRFIIVPSEVSFENTKLFKDCLLIKKYSSDLLLKDLKKYFRLVHRCVYDIKDNGDLVESDFEFYETYKLSDGKFIGFAIIEEV